jgi:hypothetical protein
MNSFNIQVRVLEEQRQDMRRAAARRRLVSLARNQLPRRPRFYNPLLVQFGGWLVALGSRLQRHYGTICEAQPVATASRASQG